MASRKFKSMLASWLRSASTCQRWWSWVTKLSCRFQSRAIVTTARLWSLRSSSRWIQWSLSTTQTPWSTSKLLSSSKSWWHLIRLWHISRWIAFRSLCRYQTHLKSSTWFKKKSGCFHHGSLRSRPSPTLSECRLQILLPRPWGWTTQMFLLSLLIQLKSRSWALLSKLCLLCSLQVLTCWKMPCKLYRRIQTASSSQCYQRTSCWPCKLNIYRN